jgi:nucleoside-diphosphate-sugar epimerase
LRLTASPADDAGVAIQRWRSDEPRRWDALVAATAQADVVVNAAGVADAGSSDYAFLWNANALLPRLLAEAAAVAGCPRLVHVSSAAVQGDSDPLTELTETRPFSPYSRSKAAGEELLHEFAGPVRAVIYRATSVQGADRPVSRQLARLASARFVPLVGDGQQPVPVALVENTAAALVFLAATDDAEGVYLHPSEGLNVRALFAALAPETDHLRLPRVLVSPAWRAVRRLPMPARIRALVRKADLILVGQGQAATRLAAAGFTVPVGPDGYRALAGLAV